MAALRGRAIRNFMYTAAVCLCTTFILCLQLHPIHGNPKPTTFHDGTETAVIPLPCRDLPGANDTLVILKTGSTELQHKLPIHVSTTLHCYPNYIIFSDIEERFQEELILDALEDVDLSFRETHGDFAL